MKIERSEGSLVADKDLFSTVDGRVVDADDPDANALIARAGAPIPEHLAQQFGIKESAEKHDEKHDEEHEHHEKAKAAKKEANH